MALWFPVFIGIVVIGLFYLAHLVFILRFWGDLFANHITLHRCHTKCERMSPPLKGGEASERGAIPDSFSRHPLRSAVCVFSSEAGEARRRDGENVAERRAQETQAQTQTQEKEGNSSLRTNT